MNDGISNIKEPRELRNLKFKDSTTTQLATMGGYSFASPIQV